MAACTPSTSPGRSKPNSWTETIVPDIATSDRQRIQEDDPRYEALLSFLRSSLSLVEKRWTEWRRNMK